MSSHLHASSRPPRPTLPGTGDCQLGPVHPPHAASPPNHRASAAPPLLPLLNRCTALRNGKQRSYRYRLSLSAPVIGIPAFMAFNYMRVVSTGRRSRPVRVQAGPSCRRVSLVRLELEDETELTGRLPVRSLSRLPSPPTPHPGLYCCAIVPVSTGPVDWKGEVEASCSILVGNDEPAHHGQLPLAFKTKQPQKEIDIMHPHFLR